MTIKQQGGIFGRNPTFNEVNTDGDVSVGGDLTVATDVTVSNGNLSITQSTPTIELIDLQDVNDVAQIFSSAGSLDLKADINNDKGSSRIKFDIDGSEVGRWLAGGGLCFNGDTAAANALDDYEEGTWTPVISDASSAGNTGTATVSYATYTKVGNLVHLKARLLNMNTTGMGPGNIYVQGVPFAADGDGEGVATTSYFTASANSLGITPSIDNSASHIKLKEVISGGVYTNADSSQFTSGTGDLWITITYHT